MKWLKYAKYRVLPIRIDPILELKDIVFINIEFFKNWLIIIIVMWLFTF